MQTHDEERDIYGTVTVHGEKYYLLDNHPSVRPVWVKDGYYWLVALDYAHMVKNPDVELGDEGDYITYYVASHIVFDSSALIDLLPVPLTKKVIRFYVTDDEEA